jgi:oxaloacetate decarboxylase alpha subunit
VLKGEYGVTPAPVNAALQQRVLEGAQPVTCRPADLLEPEMGALEAELVQLAVEKNISLAPGERQIDDVLTYALFPQVGLRFLDKRGDASAFEAAPGAAAPAESAKAPAVPAAPATATAGGVYTVTVSGQRYVVEVAEGGDVSHVQPAVAAAPSAAPVAAPASPANLTAVKAPLAGNIVSVAVAAGDAVNSGDVVIILEAMKMETEVRAPAAGSVARIAVTAGDAVAVGDVLLELDPA